MKPKEKKVRFVDLLIYYFLQFSLSMNLQYKALRDYPEAKNFAILFENGSLLILR